ncbi:MAG: pitrilysin family protein [Calditrichia bacterium]
MRINQKSRKWLLSKGHKNSPAARFVLINTPVVVFLLIFFIFFGGNSNANAQHPGETRLENNLRVITCEMHHAPLIFLGVIYDAAPRNEYIGITGISHVLEHMMFMGTKKYPGNKFIQNLRQMGASLNGFTTTDFTAYYDFFPKQYLEQILKMEADRMQNLLLDSLVFVKELEVVKNERRRKLDNSPRALIEADFKNLFYRTHPYRNPTIGYMPDLENMTLKKVRNYYHRYYRPENAVLILVGDFETANILPKVRKFFGFSKSGSPPERFEIFELPPQGKRQVVYRSSAFQKPAVYFHFHLPPITHPAAPALDALMAVLGRPSSELGRLKEVLVHQQNLAEHAGTAGFCFRDAGFLTMKVTTDDTAKFPQIETKIRQIVNELKTKPVSEEELFAYKIKTKYLRAQEGLSIRGFGEKLIYYTMMGGWQYRLLEEPKIKEQLTPADIQRVAQTYLDFEQGFTEYRIPAQSGVPGDTGRAEGDLSGERDEQNGINYFFGKSEKPVCEKIDGPTELHLSGMLHRTDLSNGIILYQLQNPASGLWGFQGFWETGNIVENDTFPGIGRLLVQLMMGDTRQTTATDLKKKLQYYQIRQGFGGGNIDLTVYGDCLGEYVDTLLAATHERLFSPKFTKEKIDEMVSRLREGEANEWNNPKIPANRLITQLLFPNHPYARENRRDPDKLQQVTPEKLQKMWRRYFCPENLTLIVYSPFDSSTNRHLIQKYFVKKWPENISPVQEVPLASIEKYPEKALYQIPNPDLKMAEIRIGFPGPDLSHPDAFAFDQMADILARGSVSSYLGSILRNQLGLTYYLGLNSESGARRYGGSLIIETQVAVNKVHQFLDTIRVLLRQFPESLTEEQWHSTRKRLNLAYLKQWDNFENVVQRLFNALREGQSPECPDNYLQRLNNLKFSDLKRVARKYIDPAKMFIVVHGNLE